MNIDNEKRSYIEEFNKFEKQAKDQFGDFLDFLDEIPNPERNVEIPFPYGNGGPRPYGWYAK